MITVYLAALFTGLLVGLFAMWHGVEPRSVAFDVYGRELPAAGVGLAQPFTAAVLVGLGSVGYLLTGHTALYAWQAALIALGVALTFGWIALSVVTRWAVPAAQRTPEDPRYLLQGVPGCVTTSVDAEDVGELSYEANGHSIRVRARSLDGKPIPAGCDVAIDRLEGDIAYVERWSEVEQRI